MLLLWNFLLAPWNCIESSKCILHAGAAFTSWLITWTSTAFHRPYLDTLEKTVEVMDSLRRDAWVTPFYLVITACYQLLFVSSPLDNVKSTLVEWMTFTHPSFELIFHIPSSTICQITTNHLPHIFLTPHFYSSSTTFRCLLSIPAAERVTGKTMCITL